MRRLALVALLGACASAPARPAVPDAPPVRLVLQPVKAAPALHAAAADLEAQICATATGKAGYQVTCVADVRAAAEMNKLRATLGQCDQGSECVDEVMRIATGEEALKASLESDSAGGLTLILTRVGSDGQALRRCSRTASDAAKLSADVASGVAEALTR